MLRAEAKQFAAAESSHAESSLYGLNDGKTIGTYLEKRFKAYLAKRYDFSGGNSASGLDFPSLNVDVKTTSAVKPQSSSPYKSARQKIFGLGYDLLVFVYEGKQDDPATKSATLRFSSVVFVEAAQTADYQTTTGLNKLLANNANEDDLVDFLHDRKMLIDDIESAAIATDLLTLGQIPVGFLTMTAVPQWRLKYTRAVTVAGTVAGIHKLL